MIHSIVHFGIRSSALTDPLPTHQVPEGAAGFYRRSRCEAEDIPIKLLHSIGRGRVKRHVIDAKNAWPLGGMSLRENRNCEGSMNQQHDGNGSEFLHSVLDSIPTI